MSEKLTLPARVILAFKRRLVRKLKRRSPSERLKSRIYYRKNKTKLKIKRRRYLRRNKTFNKSKKIFKRSVPSWLRKTKSKAPKIHKPKIKKFKFNVPKRH